MKNYLLATGFVLLAIFAACDSELINPVRNFVIKKGNHHSTHSIEMLESELISFEATFDESAIYTTEDPIQQFSTNKLIGFADCNSHHHDNSARFGWQWLEGQLEIWAYTYVNGSRIEAFVGVVEINETRKYSIEIKEDTYLFTLEGFPTVSMQRGTTCDVGVYYMLWPYFGGQETAPHDITIKIHFINR